METYQQKKRAARYHLADLGPRASHHPVTLTVVKQIRNDPEIVGSSYNVQKNDGKKWVTIGHEILLTEGFLRRNSLCAIKQAIGHELAHVKTGRTCHDARFAREAAMLGAGDKTGKYIE